MTFSSLALACILLSSAPAAPEAYFCTTEGRTLRYERRWADSSRRDGSLKWTHILSIDKVSRKDGKTLVDYSSTFRTPDGKRMYGGPILLRSEVSREGDVVVDLASSTASALSSTLGLKAESEPCPSVLPAGMNASTPLENASFQVKCGPLKYRVVVDGRKVEGRQTLKLSCGTFDCIVVSEHKVEKGPGRNRETYSRTWYAKGVGMVRHDTFDASHRLQTSELLVQITD